VVVAALSLAVVLSGPLHVGSPAPPPPAAVAASAPASARLAAPADGSGGSDGTSGTDDDPFTDGSGGPRPWTRGGGIAASGGSLPSAQSDAVGAEPFLDLLRGLIQRFVGQVLGDVRANVTGAPVKRPLLGTDPAIVADQSAASATPKALGPAGSATAKAADPAGSAGSAVPRAAGPVGSSSAPGEAQLPKAPGTGVPQASPPGGPQLPKAPDHPAAGPPHGPGGEAQLPKAGTRVPQAPPPGEAQLPQAPDQSATGSPHGLTPAPE
jgi:hypothetical protein